VTAYFHYMLSEIEERFENGADTQQDVQWLIMQVHQLREAVNELEEQCLENERLKYSLRRANMKTLHNTDANGATKNVSDIQFFGDGDVFKLICKASSESEGWMKSTKAMYVGTGVVVQVTTQQRNDDGTYSIAEALTFVPDVCIYEENGKRIIRSNEWVR
jgi:prefoldin subunit 5